jgi:hypothetical protein
MPAAIAQAMSAFFMVKGMVRVKGGAESAPSFLNLKHSLQAGEYLQSNQLLVKYIFCRYAVFCK